MHKITFNDLSISGIVFRIGVPPERIDILTFISGVKFPDARKSRMDVEIDGIVVPVLSLNDLYINKSASVRKNDAADLSKIRKLLE